jgi:hypothetical protein
MRDAISFVRRLPPASRLCAALALAACGAGRTATPAHTPAPASALRKYAIETPAGFAAAVERGTRTRTGQPGPKYWQQWAEYRLRAELSPVTKRLTGQGTATYHNRSPDTLRSVYVHLLGNLFASGAKHNTDVPWALEGVTLAKVAAQGKTLTAGAGYDIDGTVMRIGLPRPLPPGGTADFEFAWRLRVPPDGAPRGGQDGEVWFLSYWYPQFAVYDDLNGWQIDQYLGNAEFYMGYGSYDVALTLPAGWLVDATGALQNPADVLSGQTRARLDSASRTAATVRVVGDADRGPGRSTAAGDSTLTWRFRADSVRDFSWSTSSKYLWDATRAVTGTDTAMIYAFFRPEQRRFFWDRAARYGQHAIEFYSRYLWPYPYPHMSVVDGPTSCGGMEFPMMTCLGGEWDSLSLYEVTTHEIGHMWFPMLVGSDEKRHAWMDEGLTQFNQSQAIPDIFKEVDDEEKNRTGYLNFAAGRRGGEVELMRHGDRYPDYPSYGIASYYKPATVLVALRGVLGEEVFHRGLREYGRRWQYKHPSPYDLFNTFEEVAGRDLDWFWRTWFFETWTLDQAITGVAVVGDSVEIVVENRDRAPMPVPLEITRAGGAKERRTIPVDVWLGGARRTVLRVAREPAVTGVVIDPGRAFPDVERNNGTWPH